MLCVLGKVRGPHILANPDFSNIGAVRRRFLKNLAFLCDFTKGGSSTTSLAVQDRHDCNVFWIASNKGPSEPVLKFLESVIGAVKESRHASEREKTETEENLTHRCIVFAAQRVRNQARGLSSTVKRCQGHVTTQSVEGSCTRVPPGPSEIRTLRDLVDDLLTRSSRASQMAPAAPRSHGQQKPV